jgi:hypothetical protein
MGRKKKAEAKEEGFLKHISDETKETIWAIIFFVIATFLVLIAFGGNSTESENGSVGRAIFHALKFLFGIGYYLLPIILVTLGISFLKEVKNNLATPKIIASVTLFISGLVFVSLLSIQANFVSGGLVGSLIAKPLVSMFDFWVSLVLSSDCLRSRSSLSTWRQRTRSSRRPRCSRRTFLSRQRTRTKVRILLPRSIPRKSRILRKRRKTTWVQRSRAVWSSSRDLFRARSSSLLP